VYEPGKPPTVESVVLFSEPNFTGRFDVCDLGTYDNVGLFAVGHHPKSAFVPEGVVVRLYNFTHWERARAGTDPSLASPNGFTAVFSHIDLARDAEQFSFPIGSMVVALSVFKVGSEPEAPPLSWALVPGDGQVDVRDHRRMAAGSRSPVLSRSARL
jgi:hypothetical protein